MSIPLAYPLIRYETTSVEMSETKMPVFPAPDGSEYYVYSLENPKYVNVHREYPTTELQWTSERMKATNRTELWNFWNTTLARGEYDFTVMDHHKRFLFDASWLSWQEHWSKERGGVSNIVYELQSPFSWLPPLFAFYAIVDPPGAVITDRIYCHTVDNNSTLEIIDGEIKTQAQDGKVLRKNGYALCLDLDDGTAYGAYSFALSWNRGKNNDSMSIVCQASIPDLIDGIEWTLIDIMDNNPMQNKNRLRIYATVSSESSSSSGSASSGSESSVSSLSASSLSASSISSLSSNSSSSSVSASSVSASSNSSSSSKSSTSGESSISSSSSLSSSSESSLSSSSNSASSNSSSSSNSSNSSSSNSSSGSTSNESSVSSEDTSVTISIFAGWTKSGCAEEIIEFDSIETDTWYDYCLTYDGINNQFHFYVCKSATGSSWSESDNFLYNLTTMTDGIRSDLTPTNTPSNVTWKRMYLFNRTIGSNEVMQNDQSAYLQNLMIFDEFISPLQYNFLRRLFHLWNNKTSGTWPK